MLFVVAVVAALAGGAMTATSPRCFFFFRVFGLKSAPCGYRTVSHTASLAHAR